MTTNSEIKAGLDAGTLIVETTEYNPPIAILDNLTRVVLRTVPHKSAAEKRADNEIGFDPQSLGVVIFTSAAIGLSVREPATRNFVIEKLREGLAHLLDAHADEIIEKIAANFVSRGFTSSGEGSILDFVRSFLSRGQK